jgi:hypothetical protein
MKDLLTEGGMLTVWAAEKCLDFQRRLVEVFGQAEEITVQETDRRGRPTDYFIYRTRSHNIPHPFSLDCPEKRAV